MSTEHFRKNLILIMMLRNLDYRKVAILCDLTATCIHNFIMGQRLPTVESVIKLMDGLEISFDDLFCHPDRHERKKKTKNPYTNPNWPLDLPRQERPCLP